MAKSFGEILKEAREAKGLSTSQVASRTHILVKIIESLEEEDFRKIPAPIYGRGFVRLYCDCVGIDSKPLIAEYMQIQSGAKTPLYIRRKNAPAEDTPFSNEESVFSTAPEAPAVSASEPIPTETPMAVSSAASLFTETIDTPVPAPVQEPVVEAVEETPSTTPIQAEQTEVPLAVSGLELFDRPQKINPFGAPAAQQPAPAASTTTSTPTPSSYDSPFVAPEPPRRQPSGPSVAERFKSSISVFSNEIVKTVHNIPRCTWRIFALAGGIVLILFFIGWIISKLYQVTSSPSRPETPVVETTSEPAPEKPTKEVKPAKDIKKEVKADNKKDAKADVKKASSSSDKSVPTKRRGKLKSSGHPVPALYVD